jgi:hypothetical protein
LWAFMLKFQLPLGLKMMRIFQGESSVGYNDLSDSFYFNKHHYFIIHLMSDIFTLKLSFSNSSATDH